MKKKYIYIVLLILLFITGCYDNNTITKPKVENLNLVLNGGSFQSEGSFYISSYENVVSNRYINLVSKDNITLDMSDYNYERMYLKKIEGNVYYVVASQSSGSPYSILKEDKDYEYIILANSSCENSENYENFSNIYISYKSKGKYLRLDGDLNAGLVNVKATLYSKYEYAKGVSYLNYKNYGYVKLDSPIKKGYTFIGWFTSNNKNSEKIVDFNFYDDSIDTLYALYSLDEYSITYDFGGEVSTKELITSYTFESEDIILESLESDDKVFDGWYLDDSFTDKITKIEKNNIGDIKLYAKWVKKEISDMNDNQKIEYAVNKISEIYSNISIIDGDIDLIRLEEDTEAVIEWKSSDENILSNDGIFNRDYSEKNITIEATIKLNNLVRKVTFDIKAKGFKNLKKTGIKSSYIYRNFDFVDDYFFDTLDIINVAFAKANGDGLLSAVTVFNNCKNVIIPQAHKRGTWVVLSIAPESDWTVFADPSNNLVSTFAENVVNVINKYGFDGVDIDWECPTGSQKTWFTMLVKEVNKKVKANNINHIVSAAIGGGKWQPPYYDMANSVKYLDFVNMMTYGMCSSSGQYQNSLYKNGSYNDSANKVGYTLTSCSIVESIDIYDTYNVPHEKIIVGLAFYGIKQTRTYDSSSGTYSSWQNGGSIFYTSIKKNYLDNPNYTYVYDERCGVPYIISKDKTLFISFDDPRSIKEKCTYVLNRGLGGVMYWENGCDSSGDLLKAIGDTL